MYEVYQKIVSLCSQRGISPTRLCDEIGISRSTMTNLKKGKTRTVNAATAKKIADYFGIPSSDLRYADTVVSYEPYTSKADLTSGEMIACMQSLHDRPEMKMLFRAAKDATPETIEAVVKPMETMDARKDISDGNGL